MANTTTTSTSNLRAALALLLGAGLLACSGSGNQSATATGTSTEPASGASVSFVGSWTLDEPKRTPPALEPDHIERTEYEISSQGGQTNGSSIRLTKWIAVLDLKTKKQLFRDKLNGPLPCTYIPDRQCLACGTATQSVKDSLFVTGDKLVVKGIANGATGSRLVLTRRP